MINNQKQLNPFELKSELAKLLGNINSTVDIQKHLESFELLQYQDNKQLIGKILFKELVNSEEAKIPVICFMLETFLPEDMFIAGLWGILKNKTLKTNVRVMVLNLLREKDSDWSYENCEEFIEDAQDILDENTKQLLNSAIINPEVQIDFMDFLCSINTDDKITLLNSFVKDFNSDALANILIPVLESNPSSVEGKEALKLLADTKSVLALNLLERMINYTTGELNKNLRKSLAVLKMSGVREDNSAQIYKQALLGSKPDKFYVTYPDAHGDIAMIFTRITTEGRNRFVSIVINTEFGVKDCFGFFDISQFESDKIIERFLKNEKVVSVPPQIFKNILYNAEYQTYNRNKNKWSLPYEYVCWKTLLIDIDCIYKDIENYILENIKAVDIDLSMIEKLENMKISTHWFLDFEYSDEFQNLIKKLKNENNLDKLIDNNFNLVFSEEEQNSWKEKLLYASYIKYSIGKTDEAAEIFSIILNGNVFTQLLCEILKRSIYEYLLVIKYNKNMNKEMFTDEDISFKIKYIEKKWVNSHV